MLLEACRCLVNTVHNVMNGRMRCMVAASVWAGPAHRCIDHTAFTDRVAGYTAPQNNQFLRLTLVCSLNSKTKISIQLWMQYACLDDDFVIHRRR